MKTFTKSFSGLLSAGALAVGLAVIAQPAAAGIATSKHDMVNLATAAVAGTTEICVFCHTPHGSNTTVFAPLWNKALPAGVSYLTYSSATMDGVAAAGSVSLACLSCHDGTQARDNMINAPGSGGYNAPGTTSGGGANLGTIGKIPAGVVYNLGTDLTNDHPIGMIYCGATTDANALAGTCLDDSFNTSGSAVGIGKVRGTLSTRLWVETGGNTTYSKTDFPLYGDGTPGTRVECATCHDPHSTTNVPFLRTANGSSAVCLTCHNK